MLDVSATSFRSLFPDIEAGLNWQRFEREHWPVTVFQTEEPAIVGQFHSFFRSSFGRINSRGFLHGISHTMRLHEALLNLKKMPDSDRSRIEAFCSTFLRSGGTIKMLVPTYDLGARGLYLLDCNHRLCGLLLSGLPFTLTVHMVKGPDETHALSDTAFIAGRKRH